MGSWEATFYLLGIFGVIWFALWTVLVYESPEMHPFISQAEHNFILANEGGMTEKANLHIPYKEMFKSVHVYALILTHFGQNWGFLTVLNLMPSYMSTVLKMDINEVRAGRRLYFETLSRILAKRGYHYLNHILQNILISGLPYLGQALFGWVVSYITDKLRESGRFTITTLRKVNSVIAYIPPAICLALVPTARCNTTFAAILLILTITFNGACHSGINTTHADMVNFVLIMPL